jgi:hypothetical protein
VTTFSRSISSLLEGVTETVVCDRIIANVGYRPDASIYRELQVHECYATQGPMNLAASLLAQNTADCLAIQSGGADLLRNPEPDFYILGAKSFGTNSSFLLRLGHEQIAQVFTLITGDPALESLRLMTHPTVELQSLDELWFQVTGTRCNLRCTHCFISCAPDNTTFGYLDLPTVARSPRRIRFLGVKEYYFTGGEPFLHPEMIDILEGPSPCGPATVLTNGTLLPPTAVARLRRIADASPYSLEFRVSIDHFDETKTMPSAATVPSAAPSSAPPASPLPASSPSSPPCVPGPSTTTSRPRPHERPPRANGASPALASNSFPP